MSKRMAPTLSAEMLEAATTWFVEFSEGDVSQADREAFIQWLKTSPEHVRAYLQVTAHWEDARSLSKTRIPPIEELVALARRPTNINVLPIGAGNRAEAHEERAPTGAFERVQRMRKLVIAASAAFAVIVSGGAYWLEYQRGVYSTVIGEQRFVRLADGSTVELNARSRIRVSLHQNERDVDLIEGQALFRVAKDHARPFIVHSGETNVLAVGTQFDVYRHHGGTTVTVVEGRVAVFPSAPLVALRGPEPNTPVQSDRASDRTSESGPQIAPVKGSTAAARKDEILLAAGEQLTVSSAFLKKVAYADVAEATAWTMRQIVLNSTPLSDVVDEFNRYNNRPLVIVDPKLKDTKISGQFSSTNPESLLKGLDALNKFSIRETPDRIEISSK